jgi:uncharacterized protein involved in cysteine biosynthesis
MLKAASRALAQLTDPALLGVLLISVLGAALLLVVTWLGVGEVLAHVRTFQTRWLDWLVRGAIEIGTVAVTLLLYGAIAAMIAGMLVERIARAVERRYYPGLPAPREQGIVEQLRTGISFLGAVIVVNLIALPLYLVPGANVPIFLAVNGYLLGREYFELVALRRVDARTAARLRRSHSLQVLLAGVVIAALSYLPFANLLTPVLATAFMLHVVQGLPEINRGLPGSAVR